MRSVVRLAAKSHNAVCGSSQSESFISKSHSNCWTGSESLETKKRVLKRLLWKVGVSQFDHSNNEEMFGAKFVLL